MKPRAILVVLAPHAGNPDVNELVRSVHEDHPGVDVFPAHLAGGYLKERAEGIFAMWLQGVEVPE